MTQILSLRIATAVLAFALPIAALADVGGTQTLQTNGTLNLDTGAIASPGDIQWTGTNMTFQGKARGLVIPGIMGAIGFDLLGQVQLQSFAVLASTAPIPARTLTVGAIMEVITNGGNYAKVLVTANSGASITLQFTTFIAETPTGPTVAQIRNNSSLVPAGFPNYGIAPSSLFVVFGSGLSDPGDPVLQPSEAPGIPLTLNGTSLTVVVNGVTTQPALYYTSPTQLAAVLPAATPVGTGTLTVTYRGKASAPAPIRVVLSAVGINNYFGGLGVATDAVTGDLLTYTSSGSPGQTIVLWTTGLGADPADSDTTYTLTPHAVNTPLQIYFGGALARILYQGASTYPGVDVIVLVTPDSIQTGCWIPLAAVTGSVVSNVVTLPINKGGGPCIDVQSGLTGAQIQQSIGQTTLKTGLVSLIQTNSPGAGGSRTVTNSANASFQQYSGLSYANARSVSPGGCVLNQLTPNVPTFTGLDAGTITLTGPSGLAVTLASQFGIKGAFFATLAAGAIPSSGGTFTFKGSGGADVGPFTSTVDLSNPLLTWTNPSAAATIDKTQGLLVTWTGGTPGSYVFITGTAAASSVLLGGYTCLAPVEAGQFTVPSYILLGLPTGNGGTAVQNYISSSLSASGLDIAIAIGSINVSVASAYK